MTASSASNSVQAAVYALLSGDTALTALVDRIGDGIVEGDPASHYVIIAVISEVPDRRLAATGANARRVLVSVTTNAEDTQARTGAKTSQAINQRVVELLDNATLTVAGWTFVSSDLVSTTGQKDGPWRSVISDFEILVEDS